LLHPIDQLALVIGLAEDHGMTERAGATFATGADVLQRFFPVNLRLPDPQEVEVGPAKHIHLFRHSAPPSIPPSCNGRRRGSQAFGNFKLHEGVMTLTINGEERAFGALVNVAALVAELGLDARK